MYFEGTMYEVVLKMKNNVSLYTVVVHIRLKKNDLASKHMLLWMYVSFNDANERCTKPLTYSWNLKSESNKTRNLLLEFFEPRYFLNPWKNFYFCWNKIRSPVNSRPT